jgi:anaerobic selenocysteine-containing dehydrogenase
VPAAAAEQHSSEFDPPLLESRDSIVDIYGERTPYHGEGAWPVRVDSTVRADAEVSQWVPSACLLCSNGCGCEIGVSSAGKMVGIRGRADDRVNRGRLGPKGMHCFQVNHNEERLTTPLVRGKDGKLQPASWDEAMNLIVQRTQQLRANPPRMPSDSTPAVSCSSKSTTCSP